MPRSDFCPVPGAPAGSNRKRRAPRRRDGSRRAGRGRRPDRRPLAAPRMWNDGLGRQPEPRWEPRWEGLAARPEGDVRRNSRHGDRADRGLASSPRRARKPIGGPAGKGALVGGRCPRSGGAVGRIMRRMSTSGRMSAAGTAGFPGAAPRRRSRRPRHLGGGRKCRLPRLAVGLPVRPVVVEIARNARCASPWRRCRCRSRPAIGVRFSGARASRCSADAKPGQPARGLVGRLDRGGAADA